ncbi:hypothetical protein GUJ93_ZPchr0010g8731 [Zizania palustris]|uniref:Uncharacterized protein n=1 Tax=Zizania palustris TaxID=103762 RepID=A0A8J6BIL9_ZIZPA|nr:hypothetical protein GUJ93_ZPchr0010g8731 [Zizania palustris]
MARSSAPAAAASESGGPAASSGAPAAGLPSATVGLLSPFGLAASLDAAAAARPSLVFIVVSGSLAAGPSLVAPASPPSLAATTSLDAAAAARPSLATAVGSPSLAAGAALSCRLLAADAPSSLAADFPAYRSGGVEAGSSLGSVDAGVLALGTGQFTDGAPWSSPAPAAMLTRPAQHLLSLPLAPLVLHPPPPVMLSLSSSLRNESQAEKYKDLRALLRLLTNICSKDLVGFLSDSSIEGSQDIAEVIYVGLDIVTPLISLDLLKYPKLSRDYFALVSHLLEVYPEKDSDVVERCLTAVNALASYHFKERLGGRGGLSSQLMESDGSNGKLQESISSHFLRLMLQLLLFEDFRMELAGSAADALLPLLLCEHGLYQGLVQELLEKQQNPAVKSRLAMAFHNLTNSNNLSSSLDRPNRQRFRKNLRSFLGDISGFMQIK